MDRLRIDVRVAEEVPPLVTALATAEAFFRFHSFTLELIAFAAVLLPLRWAYVRSLRRVRTSS